MRKTSIILAVIFGAAFVAWPFMVPLDPAHYTNADEQGQTFIMGFLGFVTLVSVYDALFF